MRIIFFDTETTGNAGDDRLCQLAVKERGLTEPIVNEIYKAPKPISIGAMAIHHITEKMVEGKPTFQASKDYKSLKNIFENSETISVAHNASFDLGMLAQEGIFPKKSICTYKVSRALDPEEKIEQYKLQYLRYLLGLEIEASAHDAFGDVLVLEGVFDRLFSKMIQNTGSELAAIDEMIKISSQPILFSTIRFGKYAGKKIEEILRADKSYLEWLLNEKKKKPGEEADWIYTLEHYLGRS